MEVGSYFSGPSERLKGLGLKCWWTEGEVDRFRMCNGAKLIYCDTGCGV